ncbi:MAG TPA: arginine deiminase-related protein [Candidatus Binatia bacterium]|nr:arginine deiminase-related protein [Candidatus Binatia bacterium]
MPVLMCPPTHYGVEYEINPWMHVEVGVDRDRAQRQWDGLRAAYRSLGVEVVTADPVPGLPDMVFTANAGVVRDDRVVLSRFRHRERQAEEGSWRAVFEAWGMRTFDTAGHAFEGAGDALFVGDTLVCGHGFRTELAAIPLVGRALEVEVIPVELVDPRFYHLDTCLCPLQDGTLLLAPGAFSPASRAGLARLAERVIEVPGGVAAGFACNAILVGRALVSSQAAAALVTPLAEAGYRVVSLPMSEFIKAGGGVRCLSLPVEVRPARSAAATPLSGRLAVPRAAELVAEARPRPQGRSLLATAGAGIT